MPELPGTPGPQEPDVLARARHLYPFINKFNPDVVINSAHRNPQGYFAETFHPGDPGDGVDYSNPRGKTDRTVIEVYRPDKFSEHDLAAEFLHVDPKANAARVELLNSLSRAQIEQLKRSSKDWDDPSNKLSEQRRLENATDSLMRGYTIGQWPQEAIDKMRLNDRQRSLLDSLKSYMTTDGANNGE